MGDVEVSKPRCFPIEHDVLPGWIPWSARLCARCLPCVLSRPRKQRSPSFTQTAACDSYEGRRISGRRLYQTIHFPATGKLLGRSGLQGPRNLLLLFAQSSLSYDDRGRSNTRERRGSPDKGVRMWAIDSHATPRKRLSVSGAEMRRSSYKQMT